MMFLSAITNSTPYAVALILAALLARMAGGQRGWPMLIDGVLLALYLWRPGLIVLLVVAILGGIRHIRPWAIEVANWFHVQEYHGWTLRFWAFLLPALRVCDSAGARPSTDATTALPPIVQPQPIKEERDLPLLLGEGLKLLNTDPTAPHVGVIGATRLGKTTFVGVLLSYRQGELVIATPKAAQYDPWFGADVARPTIDLASEAVDYAPIEQAVNRVHQEMLRRNTPGASATPPITLVVDEWTQVVAELPALAKKVINLLRMGAGCGIRLILMATDVNVRGWKMDGSAGVLDNLVFARVEDGRQWSVGRLDPNWRLVSPRRLDTAQVWGLAERVSLAGRAWAGARGDGGGLLGALLSAGGGGGIPPVQTNANGQTQTESERRITTYQAWRRTGIKKEQARAIRHESGDGLDDAEWAEADKRNKQTANGPN